MSSSRGQCARIFGEQLTVAAGVAIVKTHYPFARAYELSEALCKSAKRLSRDVSTLDWHVGNERYIR